MDDYKKTYNTRRDSILKLNKNMAFENSYKVIIDELSIDKLHNKNGCYFIHNPHRKVTIKTLDEMFIYFKGKKMWKKCFKILRLKSKIKFKNELQRLSKKYYK
tara:strand:- start:4418 stop:4726 length:309 start_codon:yes stop_codon:yes gene_type:complete